MEVLVFNLSLFIASPLPGLHPNSRTRTRPSRRFPLVAFGPVCLLLSSFVVDFFFCLCARGFTVMNAAKNCWYTLDAVIILITPPGKPSQEINRPDSPWNGALKELNHNSISPVKSISYSVSTRPNGVSGRPRAEARRQLGLWLSQGAQRISDHDVLPAQPRNPQVVAFRQVTSPVIRGKHLVRPWCKDQIRFEDMARCAGSALL